MQQDQSALKRELKMHAQQHPITSFRIKIDSLQTRLINQLILIKTLTSSDTAERREAEASFFSAPRSRCRYLGIHALQNDHIFLVTTDEGLDSERVATVTLNALINALLAPKSTGSVAGGLSALEELIKSMD